MVRTISISETLGIVDKQLIIKYILSNNREVTVFYLSKLSINYINSCLLFTLFSIYFRLLNDLLFFSNSICFLAILFYLTNLSLCGIFISMNSALIFSKLFNITK